MSKKKKKPTAAPALLNDRNYLLSGRARSLPIDKCLINEGWEEDGIADIFIVRKHVNGHVTVGVYLVDIFCAGVKDTFYFFNIPEFEFDEYIARLPYPKEECSYELAHNIIYGAVAFAQDYGIEPHPDFRLTQQILEEDTEDIELLDIEFGRYGKPFLLINPAGDPRADYYLRQLEKNAGPGNYDVADGRTADFEDDLYAHPEDWDEQDWEEFIDETEPEKLEIYMEAALYMYDKTVAEPNQAVNLLTSETEQVGFTISYDPMPNPYSEEELKEAAEIITLIHTPKVSDETLTETEVRLQKSIEKWPQNPTFRNYLALVYRKLEKQEAADEAALQLYQKFPDYLYSRIMYAELLLDQGKTDEVPAVFNGQYSLKSVYPERNTFHISELVAFNTVMADYFLVKGDLNMARLYSKMISQLKIPDNMPLNFLLLLEIDVAITNEMKPVLAEAKQNEQKKKELIVQLVG